MKDTAIYAAVMLKAFGISNLGINECFGENRFYRDIFSHDFAKAFWGEAYLSDSEWYRINIFNPAKFTHYTEDISIKSWQYHLQQMVLEKEPLKYLEKFL